MGIAKKVHDIVFNSERHCRLVAHLEFGKGAWRARGAYNEGLR